MTMTDLPRSDASRQAEQHGLTPIGRQPSLPSYVAAIWERRFFLVAFARSRLQADNSESRLGQLWQVLNPLLNAAVYYVVFGVILKAGKSIENYIPFLITGVFIFGFTQRTIASGARAITGNMGLVRALHFPRAVLPLATVFEEILKTGTSIAVLSIIVLAYHEPLTLNWLQLPVALFLQALFSAGIAFVFARLTTSYRDVAQFLPFALRIWMYFSGVMYSIQDFINSHDGNQVVAFLLKVNPAATYIDIARGSLMASHPAPVYNWYLAVGWAVVASVFGFVFFWRAEARYGRG
jgi:teichoic acid transport system permease protein